MSGSTSNAIDPYTAVPSRNQKRLLLAGPIRITEPDPYSRALTLAVEQGLAVLGDNVSEIVFHNLDKKYSLHRSDIVDKPDCFVKALADMFGSGAVTVERLIVKSICGTAGIDISTVNPLTLLHCVEIVKNELRTRQKQRPLSI